MLNLTLSLFHAFIDYLKALWDTPMITKLRGAICALIGFLALLSFVSYHADDPSLNTVSDLAARNLLGGSGAVLADLLLQTFGLSAWPLMVFVISFGIWRLTSYDLDQSRMIIRKQAVWALLSCVCFSAAVVPLHEILALKSSYHLGGVVGVGLFRVWHGFISFLQLPLSQSLSSLCFGVLGLHAFNQALTLRFSHYKALVHNALSSIGLVCRLLGLGKNVEDLSEIFKSEAQKIRNQKQTNALTSTPASKINEAQGDKVISERETDPEVNAPLTEAPKASKLEETKILIDLPVSKPLNEKAESQTAFDFSAPKRFKLPEMAILAKPAARNNVCDEAALKQNARLLESVLAEFGVRGVIDQIRPGPVVTLYEMVPAAGVKHSRVVALADDVARNMSARSCRVSVVQGRNAIGIELPNIKRETVWLRNLLASKDYERSQVSLPMALGETIGGEPYIADLSKMPHLLIAGTTGSGKSVGVNAMILSILYRLDPDQCKFIMIDPKMLELSVYDGIPHLLSPVVTDPKKAVVALKWTVREMEDRYKRMSKVGVRNIASYNERAREAISKGENFVRRVQTGFDEVGQPLYETEEMVPDLMPFLVVVVDEVADLMMVAGKDIEGAVQRLAQMARAAGIHLIMATQRPSVDVITGTIKANFPTRISFQVTSKIDSRTILGEQGAEQLLGQGDMLYMAGGGRVTRLHGPFVSDQEVEAVAEFLRAQGSPEYLEDITISTDEEGDEGTSLGNSGDELYDKAVYFVTIERKASTSFIQRKLGIGYNRAASLMEKMEKEGVVGQANHVGKRDILVGPPAGL